MRLSLFALTVLLVTISTQRVYAGERAHPEKYYQQKWCAENHGQVEYVLPDQSRVDCLTETHAIEFDFADKWQEALGQPLFYAAATGKKAGIVLIMEEAQRDKIYWLRLKLATKEQNMDIWTIGK